MGLPFADIEGRSLLPSLMSIFARFCLVPCLLTHYIQDVLWPDLESSFSLEAVADVKVREMGTLTAKWDATV